MIKVTFPKTHFVLEFFFFLIYKKYNYNEPIILLLYTYCKFKMLMQQLYFKINFSNANLNYVSHYSIHKYMYQMIIDTFFLVLFVFNSQIMEIILKLI